MLPLNVNETLLINVNHKFSLRYDNIKPKRITGVTRYYKIKFTYT